MKDHRQGNDLAVLWSIFKDGEPFDLRGRSLKLYLKNLHERKEVEDFSVTGNEIHWTFYGKDQDTLGKHSLILVANEDEKGMITTDACDFVRLVSCSCKLQGGEDAPNVETETIELTSTLEYVAGMSEEEVLNLLDGKVDKEEGKGLSTNDYTDEDREKLAGLENYDDSKLLTKLTQLDNAKASKEDVEELVEELENYLTKTEAQTTYQQQEKGKGLSSNDYTDEEREKLASLENYDDAKLKEELSETYQPKGDYVETKNLATINGKPLNEGGDIKIEGGSGGGSSIEVDDKLSTTSENPVQNKVITAELNKKAETGAIPTKLSQLTDNVGFAKQADVEAGYQPKGNYVTDDELSSKGYATEKYVDDALEGKQDTIEDLESIRSGAGKGATAVQPSALEDYATNQQLTELSAEVGKKQDTIYDLETIRSGAAKGATAIQEVKTINGQSIVGSGNIEIQGGGGGGISTPSGDPMHYMYEAVGATYNATDADIPMVGVYGDSYVHKAKHWHLNELGDITNEEMRAIYLFANMDNSVKSCAQLMQGIQTRTNIATWSGTWNNKIQEAQLFGYASNLKTALLRNTDVHYMGTNASFMFIGCTGIEKIFPTLDAASVTSFNGTLDNCNNLRELRIKNIKVAIKFDKSPLISKASILYLIQNSAATSAMVITLHADAYARLVEDADIVAALAEKTNVSLAK